MDPKNINARPSEDGEELEITGALDDDVMEEWGELMEQTPEDDTDENEEND